MLADMRDYKRYRAYQAAYALSLEVYRVTTSFPRSEAYGITQQLRRASASVGANFAEGCGRTSEAEFARFIAIALGSANETEHFLALASDLGYLDEDAFRELARATQHVRSLMTALNARLRTPPP